MDPIKLIKRDHQTVKALFRKFESTESRDERQKLGQEIIEELSVHAAIEEQLIYPMLRERDLGRDESVLNALEEHHAVKLTLAELDKMNVDDERYSAKMHVVQESVEMHIEEEEKSLLPRLEELLEDQERESLANEMQGLKKAAPNHPHPAAPDTPPISTVSATMAKVVDAGKDLVRKVTNRQKAAGHRRASERASTPRANARKSSGANGRKGPRAKNARKGQGKRASRRTR
jgi:hemerythrin superfamily protein